MIKYIISLILIGSSPLISQKITQIKFEGLIHLSKTTAQEISGIKIGEKIDNEKINQSIKNFFAQGYFRDVLVDKRGGVITYKFKEKISISNIKIKGYGSKDEGTKLLNGIGIKKGDLYDNSKIKRAKKVLIARLENQGYYDSVVEISQKSIGVNNISLIFDVNKGEKIIVKKMNFIGAKQLKQEEIESDLINKEKDFWGWFPWRNNGEASVAQLEADAHRAKNSYMKRGYLDAKVSKPLMKVDFGSYNAQVDYQIEEGVQYHVGTIKIKENIKDIKTTTLKDLLLLKEEKVFNVTKMHKDVKRITQEVGNYGFAYVKVVPKMNKNTQQKIVNIEYVVEAGELVTINDVVISGNNTTKDRVIRRYIYLSPGDKFNSKDLRDSKSALSRTGFFEKVDIKKQRVSKEKINLLVRVKETSTGTISAGGGYGSYEGFMVNASISDKNIFGSGINTTLGFEVSKISKNANISFVNPKIWDSMYSLGIDIYKKDYEYVDYTQDQLGGSITIGREFYRYFHASLGVGYVDNESTMNNANNINYSYLYNDQYEKTSLYASLNFNNTDDYYTPRRGVKVKTHFEYATLNGDDFDITIDPDGYGNFLKTTIKVGVYYGMEDILDYDLIFRLKGRMSNISSNNDEKLPTAEKLFMGGVGSVRGYEPYSLSPQPNNTLSGGRKRASASIEASIPLSEAAKMRLAFFYDYGMIGEDSFSEITRSSTGVVLEWRSAFGPINFVFAKPLDDKKGDKTAAFEFSMGTKF